MSCHVDELNTVPLEEQPVFLPLNHLPSPSSLQKQFLYETALAVALPAFLIPGHFSSSQPNQGMR